MEELIIDNVKITHPNKVLFYNPLITKLDVINYYKGISDLIIPFLKDRPISMVRSPNGIKGPKFYQKHPTESFPEYIERVVIKEATEEDVYITVDQVNDLLYLVNIGVLEFHVWGSKVDSIENPDTMVFDLDPSEQDVKKLRELAWILKELLETNGYIPNIKTSGSKGFHIYTSVKNLNWSDLFLISKTVAETIMYKNPLLYTTEFSKHKRGNKIFIDYLRNQRGSTTVSAYSLRIKEALPLSMPFRWSELDKITPTSFNISNFMNLKLRK